MKQFAALFSRRASFQALDIDGHLIDQTSDNAKEVLDPIDLLRRSLIDQEASNTSQYRDATKRDLEKLQSNVIGVGLRPIQTRTQKGYLSVACHWKPAAKD